MTSSDYTRYAKHLKEVIADLRASKHVYGILKAVVVQDAFSVHSFEAFGQSTARFSRSGHLNSSSQADQGPCFRPMMDLDQFLDLPSIYAYKDQALRDHGARLRKAHWDGALACVDVFFANRMRTWHQRMLFIGFEQSDADDLVLQLDGDILRQSREDGNLLFEWRACDLDDGLSATVRCRTAGPPSWAELDGLPTEVTEDRRTIDLTAAEVHPEMQRRKKAAWRRSLF